MIYKVFEAIQALPEKPTHLPLNDEATRTWLKEHGFDLARWIAWWDQPDVSGNMWRHFRQDIRAAKSLSGFA